MLQRRERREVGRQLREAVARQVQVRQAGQPRGQPALHQRQAAVLRGTGAGREWGKKGLCAIMDVRVTVGCSG